MNAKTELLKLAGGEEIIAIRIGDGASVEKRKNYVGGIETSIALNLLDFEFFPRNDKQGKSIKDRDPGNTYALFAWTMTKIIIKVCYDGAEWFSFVPRNPEDCIDKIPESFGGG